MTPNTRHLTSPATVAPDWEYAACRQVDPDLFFPVGHTLGWLKQIEQAKQVCNRCPMRSACLEWALSTGQWSGVWGGLTETERRTLARGRVDRARSYELCIKEQEYIEKRVAEGATQRTIADELGVGHNAVSRAWQYFLSEKDTATAGEGVAA
ncbi:Transcriptional regulator WhiB1 [Streptomyces sp. 111WW2]|nr:Transcriptional regulator WhiB1 [Streptomyces sp. 111WW2]